MKPSKDLIAFCVLVLAAAALPMVPRLLRLQLYPGKHSTDGELSSDPTFRLPESHAITEVFQLIRSGDSATLASRLTADPRLARASGAEGYTPLMAAVEAQNPGLVHLLLAAGADPKATVTLTGDSFGAATALSLAVIREDLESARLLLAAGADPNSPGSYGGSTLADALATGNSALVDALRAHGAVLRTDAATLLGAAAGGFPQIVKEVLAAGVDVNSGAGYKASMRALMGAAARGDTVIVRMLLNAGANLESAEEATQRTALGFAAEKGQAAVVAILLEAGAHTEGHDSGSMVEPSLLSAVRGGHVEVVRQLLEAGANPRTRFLDQTAVDLARSGPHGDVLAILEQALDTRDSVPGGPVPATSGTFPDARADSITAPDSTQERRAVEPSKEGNPPAASVELSNTSQLEASTAQAIREGRYEKAYEGYRQLAATGSAKAQGWLGWMLWQGLGVEKDPVTARSWFLQAAEAGEMGSQKNLADLYRTGVGGPKDSREADRWYRLALGQFLRAAEGGDTEAQNTVGMMYYGGQGIKRDFGVALQWFRKAAEQGLAKAQRNLGFMYLDGAGVRKDRTEGVRWLQAAARQGDLRAQQGLRELRESW